MQQLTPFYEKVQTHYDLSDDFFELFLDPTRTYSCAYFECDDMNLEEARIAKVDLALRKCDLRPGMTLLDIGCGWGSTMMRAAERYDVHVIGLTLSRNQYEHVSGLLSGMASGGRTAEVRLQGWEEFDEPVDRIVSIGAFEHFRRQRYETFFDRASRILPDDGRMLLHTIVGHSRAQFEAMKVPVTREDALFLRFIMREIFPGGQLPDRDLVITGAQRNSFWVQNIESLQPHYARTLDLWARALEARRNDAVRMASEEVYQRYIRYLTGCAANFRRRLIDVQQFTLVKQQHR
ncbi:cyclopropane mycolic acid synthase family methyltransferase [Rhodococcus sp. D-6]|uniref:Cyclopropane mycolic acid synthase family methyltransferase n=1 Tax=Rhodococcus sp. D-6 TaxID=1387842 RepID=A0AAU7V2L2_9NOCA|nr:MULTISPECIES: cyclopropane mycolic acid synthase family methyltransferase [unclassified Rhodococcus (in: high G+C Gram-positive bacteria)]AOD23442.1 SAM-dependent methyltransferase [Rhodococcus sp. p52]